MEAEATAEKFLGESIAPETLLKPLPDAASSQIIARLKQEADRHWDIDPRRSLELADRIIAIGRARCDAGQIALGMMARGDALKMLGETNEAWELLEQAGAMFSSAGDEVGWARTRIGRLHLGVMLNRIAETLEDAERAREIFIRHDEREKLLRLTFMTAYVYQYQGDMVRSLEVYRSALALAEQLGEAGEGFIGKIIQNMGTAYENLGNLQEARRHYEQAYARFITRGDTIQMAISESNLASLAQSQGHYRQALELLNQALEHVGECTELEAAKTQWHMLDCYLNLHRLDEARQLAWQIVEVFRKASDLFELSRSLLQLATVEAELGNFIAAQDALDEAEAIFVSEKAVSWKTITWLKCGQIALRQGQSQIAYQDAARAAAGFEADGEKINHANAILLQGQASLALGDYVAAQRAGKHALRVAQEYAMPPLRYSAHLLLGQVAEEGATLRRAQRHYRAALATSERLHRHLTITLRPSFLEDKTEAWRRLIGMQLSKGGVGKAFETLERAKSQVLLGYLVNRESLRWAQEDAHSRILIEELEQLRGEHQYYYRLAHELPDELHSSPSSNLEQTLGEVRSRERRMRAITEQLYLRSGVGRSENPAPTPALEDIQHTLDKNTLLVEYYSDGRGWWAFTLDGERLQAHSLPVETAMLEQLQMQLRGNLGAALQLEPGSPACRSLTRHAQRILQRFYNWLFAPLARELHGKSRLVIVPYGDLHALPFHLLHDGHSYLIEQCEVVVLPAAGLATQPEPQRQPGVRALAHSWEGRLPNTRAEAQAVQQTLGGDLFLEENASRCVLHAPPVQVLHIAAHGQFRLDQPELSYIQLADGQVYADDLFQQDLSYELVTLSACETGQAKASGGDELIGLGRGFLYAGAGALALSLWQVADATTRHLMEVMYRGLRKGESKPAALRAAQRSILAEETDLHPAYWGAFEIIGSANPLSTGVECI